ncbi:MAG: tetratricopeptide repeat protein [Gammaproteobacteria bacterium]
MRAFLSELRRRNVYKVGAAYAVVGWIVIQVASVVIPTFSAPGWVVKVIILLVVLGFPLALALSWAFEITPEGLKRTHEVPLEHSITASTGRKLDFAIIGLLIVALGFSISFNLNDTPGVRAASIAVLPFTSRSTDPQHALFADGMHDELLTSLAKIGSLKVISRTSVMEYRDTTKKLRQIGKELGVATVLEGAVQRAGDTVRINVQLIDAGTDEHVWANTYDRRLSTENIFAIQTEIATTIAEKLQATLTPDEKERVSRIPTGNLEAYNAYIAGRQKLYQREIESLQSARGLFERAIALDPEFAQAYAGLADTLHILYYNHGILSADEAFTKSAALLDKALSMESEDADIHASIGLLKTGMWETNQREPDARQAEEAFGKAIALNPNHAQAIAWYASLASDLGDETKSIELFERSLELDPLARVTRLNLGVSYARVGDNARALDRWLEITRLDPDWPTAPESISFHLANLGRLDEALAWYHKARSLSADPALMRGGISTYMAFGQTDRALELLHELPRDHGFWILAQAQGRRFEGDYAGALALLEGSLAQLEHAPPPFLFVTAAVAIQHGNFESARRYLEQLCPRFTETVPRIDALNCSNGVGYAYALQQLGEPERAEQVLEATLKFLQRQPRLGLVGYGIADVETLVLMGRPEQALARLREAIDDGWRSPWTKDGWSLDNDPYLVELHDEPEFRAIVAEVDVDIARMRDRAMQAEASGNWEPLLALAGRKRTLTAETLQR